MNQIPLYSVTGVVQMIPDQITLMSLIYWVDQNKKNGYCCLIPNLMTFMNYFVSKSNVFIQCKQCSPNDSRTFDSNELVLFSEPITVISCFFSESNLFIQHDWCIPTDSLANDSKEFLVNQKHSMSSVVDSQMNDLMSHFFGRSNPSVYIGTVKSNGFPNKWLWLCSL